MAFDEMYFGVLEGRGRLGSKRNLVYGGDTIRKTESGVTPAALGALLNDDFENFLAASRPGGIEAQEAAGQAKLCQQASRLPVDLGYSGVKWGEIERFWGIKHGEVTDKIFYSVTLPEGWKLVPTDHSMWSKLVDGNGSERAAIFFKAAFYDYNAHLSVSSRYYSEYENRDDSPKETSSRYLVKDRVTGEVLHKTDWTGYSAASEEVSAWKKEHYPDESPFAYWPDCEAKK